MTSPRTILARLSCPSACGVSRRELAAGTKRESSEAFKGVADAIERMGEGG